MKQGLLDVGSHLQLHLLIPNAWHAWSSPAAKCCHHAFTIHASSFGFVGSVASGSQPTAKDLAGSCTQVGRSGGLDNASFGAPSQLSQQAPHAARPGNCTSPQLQSSGNSNEHATGPKCCTDWVHGSSTQPWRPSLQQAIHATASAGGASDHRDTLHAWKWHLGPRMQRMGCGSMGSGTVRYMSTGTGQKARLLFLGSPQFAALVLRDLFAASRQPRSAFEVAGVVSRGHVPQDSNSQAPTPHLSSVDGQPEAAAAAARTGRSSTPAGRREAATATAAAATATAAAATATAAVMGSQSGSSSTSTRVSPVVREALSQGLKPHQVLCPSSAKEAWFLDAVSSLAPDLCVTAAYGNMLPQRLLDMPRLGTVNIHPSLLPKYRGAAPVPRCLLDGCERTGVSLAMTVLKCDAGPLVAQQQVEVGPDEQTPELTNRLFSLGSALLLRHLPDLLSGEAQQRAVPQKEAEATHAAKLSKEDAVLDLSQPAHRLHDRVRALAGWPGTRASLLSEDSAGAANSTGVALDIKVLRTRVITHASVLGLQPPAPRSGVATQQEASSHTLAGQQAAATAEQGTAPDAAGTVWTALPGLAHPLSAHHVSLVNGHALVPCGSGTWLELLEVRHSSRADGQKGRASRGDTLTGAELVAGLGKRRLRVMHTHAAAAPCSQHS